MNVGLALLFSAVLSPALTGIGMGGFVAVLGVVSVFGGALNILIGLLLLLFKRKVWGQGYLLSAGILLLGGFALCSLLR